MAKAARAPQVEDLIFSIFEPDAVLPAQYFETICRKTPLQPEKRLMFAVLEDAVACFQKYLFVQTRKGKRRFLEVEEWFLDDNGEDLFSFKNICDVLGFDTDYIRKGLIDWKERSLLERPFATIYHLPSRPARRKAGILPQGKAKPAQRNAAQAPRKSSQF